MVVEANDSSVDNDERGNKRLKLMQHKEEEEEDRISALPDSIIKHILSFLPSTKESIQTGILSKRWRKQWSRVPVLIFDFKECDIDGKDCATWVENTISQYECSKMKKFHIGYRSLGADTSFNEKILFAVRRNVEELSILDYSEFMNQCDDDRNAYMLPEFIFDNTFLVKFTFSQCGFQLSKRVNWPSLKELTIDLFFQEDGGSIENVLSGSPSLEFLKIWFFTTRTPVTIASKSLKKLNFEQYMDIRNNLEISCPNLEELSIFSHDIDEPPIFPHKTLLNVLSRSPLLHSLRLHCFLEPPLVIVASKSLKELVLSPRLCAEISCPNLEKLIWFGSDFEKCKLINLPASCRVTLNFETSELEACDDNLARKILLELQPVKELIVFNWFVKVLSALDMEKESKPSLNVKCLTINSPNFGHAFGILKGLCCSPVLERLVINLHVYHETADGDLDLKLENIDIPEADDFNYDHLKTVKIIGLSKKDILWKAVLYFVAVLLKNTTALEKMTVIIEDGGKDFLIEVSRILLRLRKRSPNCIVELL